MLTDALGKPVNDTLPPLDRTVAQVHYITDIIRGMIDSYNQSNLAATDSFLDHMYRIVSRQHEGSMYKH